MTRYGRHSVENYELEHPEDSRVQEVRAQLEVLRNAKFNALPGETPLDHKHRIEQTYDDLEMRTMSPQRDLDELTGYRDRFIQERTLEMKLDTAEGVQAQRDARMQYGGQAELAAHVAGYEREVRAGQNREFQELQADYADRQAARQEYVSNHLVAPEREAKLQELGLDKVQETSAAELERESEKAKIDALIKIPAKSADSCRHQGPEI